MTKSKSIEIQIEDHPSGNRTMKERAPGDSTWVDVREPGLLANSDAASFYQLVAYRLAKHAREGTEIVSYKDITPRLTP